MTAMREPLGAEPGLDAGSSVANAPCAPGSLGRAFNALRYGRLFYEVQITRSRSSADVVVPVVMDLLHPTSVVDVGCGVACWLAAFRAAGVEDVLGIDGDWVPRPRLQIPRERFKASNVGAPLRVDRRVDLAMSLEVGEHLPADQAGHLVDSLTALSDRVLFSAAAPHQGGAGHVNEQWPDWWAERFAERGYLPIDCIRPRIWQRKDVAIWYRQNALIFATPAAISADPTLAAERARTNDQMLAVIHPDLYQTMVAKGLSASVRTYTQAAQLLYRGHRNRHQS